MALDVHKRACRANGARLPEELEAVAKVAWERAKSASKGQDGTSLDAIAEALHGRHMLPLLHKLEETAELLGISLRTVKCHVADGLLPAVLDGAPG